MIGPHNHFSLTQVDGSHVYFFHRVWTPIQLVQKGRSLVFEKTKDVDISVWVLGRPAGRSRGRWYQALQIQGSLVDQGIAGPLPHAALLGFGQRASRLLSSSRRLQRCADALCELC